MGDGENIKIIGITDISVKINLLIDYWKGQSIDIIPRSINDIKNWVTQKSIALPNDFEELYSKVNGMKNLYPNETDEEGFLFYPIESIILAKDEFENSGLMSKREVLIFAEYMHKSWWYGFEMGRSDNYTIGIIPDKDTFKPITNSLAEFIELYIEDSPKLYDYS